MIPQDVIDLVRTAILETLILSAPVLIAAMVVGLAIGLLQALTQVQEQTVSFVPKLVATVAAMTLALPWLLTRFVDYVQELYRGIPGTLN